jgi:hypothetical protein
LSETTPQPQNPGDDASSLSVGEIAELEAGADGGLSPFLARLDIVVSALICLAAGVLAVIMPRLVTSGGIEIGRSYATMSPSLIPSLIFAILAIVAAVATLAAVSRFRRLTTESPGDEADRFARAGVIALIILLYALTVTWLGFILSTMIVAVLISWFLGLRNPLAFVPGAVIIPILIRFVFERLLLISLPRSRIESIGHIEDVVIRFLVQNLLQ